MIEASTSSSDHPPIDIEDVVRIFSKHLSKFKFERAMEYIEEMKKTQISDCWPAILAILSQLSSAESQYFSLSFFSSKFSFRKETQLKDSYSHINSELEILLDNLELEPKAEKMDFLLIFLRQFSAVALTRIKLIEFYSFLSACNWRTFGEDALSKLAEISESLDNVFKNVIRFQQFSNLCAEISVLQKLFKAQEDLLEVPMVDTILQMKVLQTDLSNWLESVNIQEDPTKRSFFSFAFSNKGKSTSKFALLYWIYSFYNFLMAKINLYYYLTITNYLPAGGDSRPIIANSQPSFLQQFHTFMRRSNAQLTALILNRIDLKEPFFDFSYHKFLKKYSPEYCKPITGIKGHFPALVYFPQEKVFDKYHPSITSLIQDICMRGEQNDKIKFLYDARADETYFITNVEKRVYLAVVFDRKIVEKDPIVQGFFNEILLGLRGGAHLIHELKFGFK